MTVPSPGNTFGPYEIVREGMVRSIERGTHTSTMAGFKVRLLACRVV